MFLTGPRIVKHALGEDVTASALGGVQIQQRNGVCDFVADDDHLALALTRELLGYLPRNASEPPPRAPAEPSTGDPPDVWLPQRQRSFYDVRTVIAALVDGGRFLEVGSRWARNMVTGFARLEGHPIGVVANQSRHLGGIIDVDGSQKGAKFVRTCDAFRIPLLVLVDTPGFMPGSRQESAGVIRHGADLLRAFAGASCSRVTVVLRKAFGGAFITMNSKDLGADAAFAWPTAEIGIMGPRELSRSSTAGSSSRPRRRNGRQPCWRSATPTRTFHRTLLPVSARSTLSSTRPRRGRGWPKFCSTADRPASPALGRSSATPAVYPTPLRERVASFGSRARHHPGSRRLRRSWKARSAPGARGRGARRRSGSREPFQGARLLEGGSRHKHPPYCIRGGRSVPQWRPRACRRRLSLSADPRRGESLNGRPLRRGLCDRLARSARAAGSARPLRQGVARGQGVPRFTSISDPYEEPLAPELVLHTEREVPEESAERVVALLDQRAASNLAA